MKKFFQVVFAFIVLAVIITNIFPSEKKEEEKPLNISAGWDSYFVNIKNKGELDGTEVRIKLNGDYQNTTNLCSKGCIRSIMYKDFVNSSGERFDIDKMAITEIFIKNDASDRYEVFKPKK